MIEAGVLIDLDAEAAQVREVIEAGWQARAYVLGGQSTWEDPADLNRMVKWLARHQPYAVAEFLRGYAEHHDTVLLTVPGPVVWHRFIGGVRWEVAA